MSICLLDTSVFVGFLNVPNMNTQHAEICDELKQKIRDGEFLFLPLATILETGNHIAQNGNGTQRRKIAVFFVEQVQLALEGKSPFTPIVTPKQEAMQQWLTEFPDFGTRTRGPVHYSRLETNVRTEPSPSCLYLFPCSTPCFA